MTQNRIENEILSIREAEFLANLFDKFGDHRSANLIDDYIQKMGKSGNDIIKQAGLFKNLMRKLVGFGKKVFFSVYRELYSEAQEAQSRLDERLKNINNQYKGIKKDLKYHDLEGWRAGVHALNLADSKEIVGNFDVAYGKLVQYLGLTGEGKEGKSPTDESQIGKLPDLSPEKEVSPPEDDRWSRQTPGAREGWTEIAQNVSFNKSQGSLRFIKKYFDYLLGKHITTDGAGHVRYWSAYSQQKQPMQGKIKDIMGDGVWDIKEDENYVYLYSPLRGDSEGAPPVETKHEEPEFESPKLPKPEGEKEEPREEVEPEEPREGVVPEEPREEVKPEEIKEEIETKPEEVKEEEPKEEVEPEEPKLEEVKPEGEQKEKSLSRMVRERSSRKSVWIEVSRQQRREGELWTRFTKVYPETARKNYEKAGKGSIVKDPELIAFLDRIIPKEFPGHSANITKVWLPSDLDRRKQYFDVLEKHWASQGKTSSRIDKIKELYIGANILGL